MIKYDKTKWVDGTTVLRASHMEKIEKGITDIIDYNNSIYTDEAKRKENEIKREEEHNKRLEEINSSIKDIQTDYDSLQKVIIDENASANLQNQINQTNSQLEHKPNKNHVWNMANMGQDVKEAMTGGSVAVVGENTILSENIVDNQVTYKKTDFLELDTSINLFDGIYQPIHIAGTIPMYVNNNTSSKTAIVEIKPNTTYSIIKDKASRFNLGTSTEIIEPSKGLSLDGSVLKPMGNSSKLYTIITTGENDKYLYVNVTADNEDIFLQIIEGEQTNLSVNTYPLIFTKNVMAYNKKEIDEQVNKINNKVIDKEHVDFITIDSDLNLYTGLKLKNKRIGGDIGKGIKLEYSSSSDVFIVPIEANKTYSVVVKDTDLIYNEKKYIKIMTCAKLYEPTDFEGTTSIKVEHLEYLQPTNSNICATFTTGENSRYMYLYLFTNNLQEENKVFQVVEGSQTSLTISNMDDCYVFHGVSCYPKHKTYTKEEVDTLLEDIPKNSNTFIKNGEVCEILLNNKVGYKLEHKVTNSINLDTWMLTKGTVNNTTLWSGSDIEAPIKEKGAADFIGGVHGDEVFESASIVCDGNLIDMEKDYNVSFENLSIFVKSTLYRCETSTPVFTRYKKLEFVNGELIISNRLICLVDNFLVERYTGCGLYSVYKDLLLGYTVNTKPELITEGGLGADANMDIGTFFGDGYTVTLKTLSGKTEYFKGYVADFASESRPRYKLYFDCIKSSSGYQLNTDDELNTCFSIKID